MSINLGNLTIIFKNKIPSRWANVMGVLRKGVELYMNSFIPEDGFYLYEPSSIHTFSVTREVSRFDFESAYFRLKNDYIQSYSKYSKDLLKFFPNNYADFPFDESSQSIRKVFREIPVRNGISIRLSFCKNALNYNERHCKHIKIEYAESDYITLILNPELIVSSYLDDFDAKTHNYIKIAPREYEFWLKFDKYYRKFIREWNLPENFIVGYPKRLDLSATIKIPSDFNKNVYLDFISKSPRRYSYSEKEFYRSSQDDHQSMAYNCSQAITVYDKNFEQLSKFNNELFDDYLRFENQLNGQKIKNIIRSYTSKGYINPNIKYSSLYDYIWFKCYIMTNISHMVMIESIDRIYPYGDIIDIQRAYRRIIKSKKWYGINFQDSTKDDLRHVINSFSKCKSYNDTKEVENNLRKLYGDQKYRRLLNLLEDIKTFPICIPKNSWLKENIFIGPRDMFVSSIFNSYPELNSSIDNSFLSIPDNSILDLLK